MNTTHNRDFYLRWAAWLALLITSAVSVCWRAFLPAGEYSTFFEGTMVKYVTVILILFTAALISFDIIGFFRKTLDKLHLANPIGILLCNVLVWGILAMVFQFSKHPVPELYRNGSLLITMFFFLVLGRLDFQKQWCLPLILLPLLGEAYSIFLVRSGYAFGIYIALIQAAYLLASFTTGDNALTGAEKKKLFFVLGVPTLAAMFCFIFLRHADASKLTDEWLVAWKNGAPAYQAKFGGTFMFVALTSLHLCSWFILSIATRGSSRNTFIVRFSMVADMLFILLGTAAWYGVVPAPSALPIPFRTFSTARISFLIANAVFYRRPKPSAFWQELWTLVAEEEEKSKQRKAQRAKKPAKGDNEKR